MKYYYAFFLLLFTIKAEAQFTKLFDFNDSFGINPSSSLIYDGVYLYGMTTNGGTGTNCLTGDCGVIFKIKPDGSGYEKILDFDEYNGAFPHGSVILVGEFLYGMTYKGGEHGSGIVFRIKTDGSNYEKILDFDGDNGSAPKGELYYDGNYLFGMTLGGGATDHGTIFRINPDGTDYTRLHDFTGSVTGNGPYGTLISDSVFLYGTTYGGGIFDKGTIFKVKPDGTEFTSLYSFDGLTGRNPWGNLLSDGNFMYGMTYNGGNYGFGAIFKIKSDGSEFTIIHDFDDNHGSHPEGNLIFYRGKLYGLTHWGGTSNNCSFECGVLFKLNTDGTGYSVLVNFNETTGSDPKGELITINSTFYGMTYQGGEYRRGTIFKYEIAKEIDLNDNDLIFPNPFTNSLNLSGTTADGSIIIYDITGRAIIRQQSYESTTMINANNIASGLYLLQYIDQELNIKTYKLVKN
ncbi:MAG TPA: T9SS type A sorting domain-containing protein [Chitinophagales bacterium]|nr:T9SS type A sorting domain-containing protein [Chitinophagales bacterium]